MSFFLSFTFYPFYFFSLFQKSPSLYFTFLHIFLQIFASPFSQIQIFFNMQGDKSEYQAQLQLHQEQQQMIRQEMQAESPLISELRPVSLMLDEFVNNEGFYIKVQNLHKDYSQYRKTRRDGSCFYRALTFCIFEAIHVRKDTALKEKMTKKLKDAKQYLLKANFEGVIFEDMQELFLQKLGDNSIKNIDDVISIFCDPSISNYLVLMMRFITSGELKNNSIIYETFIENQIPIEFFCQTEVEQIDKEADQIQIMALLNYLDVGIKIIYLDSNVKSKEAYTVILPESVQAKDVKATLLYRPGHYDILY